jgi:hypothetical protein
VAAIGTGVGPQRGAKHDGSALGIGGHVHAVGFVVAAVVAVVVGAVEAWRKDVAHVEGDIDESGVSVVVVAAAEAVVSVVVGRWYIDGADPTMTAC